MQFIYIYDLAGLRELWSHLDQRMFSKLENDFAPGKWHQCTIHKVSHISYARKYILYIVTILRVRILLFTVIPPKGNMLEIYYPRWLNYYRFCPRRGLQQCFSRFTSIRQVDVIVVNLQCDMALASVTLSMDKKTISVQGSALNNMSIVLYLWKSKM